MAGVEVSVPAAEPRPPWDCRPAKEPMHPECLRPLPNQNRTPSQTVSLEQALSFGLNQSLPTEQIHG